MQKRQGSEGELSRSGLPSGKLREPDDALPCLQPEVKPISAHNKIQHIIRNNINHYHAELSAKSFYFDGCEGLEAAGDAAASAAAAGDGGGGGAAAAEAAALAECCELLGPATRIRQQHHY